MLEFSLSPSSAFAGALAPAAGALDSQALFVAETVGLGAAAVMARKAEIAALYARLGELCGVAVPLGPRCAARDGVTVIATGPGTLLILKTGAGPLWANALGGQLAGLASVSDQSSAYGFVELSGSWARDLLQRGLAIDLDPSVFGPGAAAVSTIAHIGAVVWTTDGARFHLTIPRSLAASFCAWLAFAARALDHAGPTEPPLEGTPS